MDCSTPSLPVHQQLLVFTQTHAHRVSDAIQPSHPLSSTSPPAFNLSQHQGLSSESVLHISWPKYWSFSFSISPSNEYSGLISFSVDWFDLLAVQETLKSLLQHHSSKASVLWHSAFFMVQLSHPYMTTGKTIALARRTFVGQVMSLLFNMLFRFVIALLPRSKHVLTLWLQSPSSVILEPPKIKSVTAVWCLVTQLCQTLCDPIDCSLIGFSVHGDSPGKNTGYALPCPPPGDLPNPGIEPRSLVLQAGSLPFEPSGKPRTLGTHTVISPPAFYYGNFWTYIEGEHLYTQNPVSVISIAQCLSQWIIIDFSILLAIH